MKFIVDRNLPLVTTAFGALGEVKALDTAFLTNASVRNADVLIVRSETTVDRALLEGSRVKFVGTATIGTDHVDLAYLSSKSIAFASASGCNANSVKEYIVSALLFLSSQGEFALKGKSIGVVGVGNVGSKVVQAAETLGMRVLQNDPPLARQTGDRRFVPLDELMEADIITLHVPLTRSGPDATHHLFGKARFGRLRPGAIFINTSRGAVVESQSLREAVINKQLRCTVLDVWENEPNIDAELLNMVTLGTPHIAGYSMEGKTNAVRMVRESVCQHFGISSSWDPAEELGDLPAPEINVTGGSASTESVLHQIVSRCYDIRIDDANLRRTVLHNTGDRGEWFRKLRSTYRVRREFSNSTVRLSRQYEFLADTIVRLGFKYHLPPL